MKAWKPPRGRVLVLAPHPDDETLGCGGALILHQRRKDPVRVVFATGDAERQAEARAAARVLGVKKLEFWGYPNGRLKTVRGLAGRLAELIETLKPEVLYRPGTEDPHPDHRALALAAEKALRRLKPSLLDCRYEVWSRLRPDAVLDITGDFAQKAKALSVYRSQLKRMDFLKMVRRLNASRGLFLGGARYGEGFRIREHIRR